LGKTAIASTLLRQKFDLHSQRVMILVDRIELVFQFQKALGLWFPEIDQQWTIHSRPGRGMVMNTHWDSSARVVVATAQTLAVGSSEDAAYFDFKRTEDILQYGPIDLLILDEVHSSVNPRTMGIRNLLLSENPGMKTLGMSGTPRRHDGLSLRGIGLDSQIQSRSILWGIQNGFLSPLIGAYQFYSEMAGTERNMKMGYFDNAFELMLESWKENAEGRKTLWFMDSVEQSRAFCSYLQELGHKAAQIDSESCIAWDGSVVRDKYARERILTKFREEPDHNHIVNYDVLSTGFDLVEISCICINRSTDSQVWITQAAGRGVRLAEGKDGWMILDFATKSLELFLDENDLLEGYDYREKGKRVEDDEEMDEGDQEGPDDLTDDEIVTGRGVIIKIVDLFDNFGGDWHMDEEQIRSLQVSSTTGLVILPPRPEKAEKLQDLIEELRDVDQDAADSLLHLRDFRDSYSLWWVTGEERESQNGRKYTVYSTEDYPVYSSPHLDLVLDMARPYKAAYAEAKLFQPGQAWRKHPPSQGQVNYIRRLGYAEKVHTKGEAARLITHYTLVPKVIEKVRTMMNEANDRYKTLIVEKETA
jgi:superfamily II DNA or RNA helicase